MKRLPRWFGALFHVQMGIFLISGGQNSRQDGLEQIYNDRPPNYNFPFSGSDKIGPKKVLQSASLRVGRRGGQQPFQPNGQIDGALSERGLPPRMVYIHDYRMKISDKIFVRIIAN